MRAIVVFVCVGVSRTLNIIQHRRRFILCCSLAIEYVDFTDRSQPYSTLSISITWRGFRKGEI